MSTLYPSFMTTFIQEMNADDDIFNIYYALLYTGKAKLHLRVSAGDGLLGLLDTSSDANAVLVSTRVGHSS